MTEQVSVVGAGVVGLTTGVYLNLQGYDTRIYAREIPYEGEPSPSVATNYAAASVKPVVVDEDDIGGLTRVSDLFFERVGEATDAVRRQDNFEVYEDGGDHEPDHADDLRGYRTLDDHDGDVPTPEGVDEDGVSGYVHEVFFIEMPRYVPELLRWYRGTGGEVEERELDREGLANLGGDTVVNATGNGNLSRDDGLVPVRGHLVHAEVDGEPRDADGDRLSYSYYLDDDRFVYGYPRGDALVLGGSTHEGEFVDGEWVGETPEETVSIDGVDVPRHILDTNREILRGYGVGIGGPGDDALTPRYGYRPYRRGGVRTEREEVGGTEVVHCYGHGGAGVTLSWLSADRVHSIISGDPGRDYAALDALADIET